MGVTWQAGGEWDDIRYETAAVFDDSSSPLVAKITINRPEVRNAFRPQQPAKIADPVPSHAYRAAGKQRIDRMQKRDKIRIGMPRVLNMYSTGPFWMVRRPVLPGCMCNKAPTKSWEPR